MTAQFQNLPFPEALPAPLYFRLAFIPEGGFYPLHRHPWGHFVYAFHGSLRTSHGGKSHLIPSQYGLWLPPGLEHQTMSSKPSEFSSFYAEKELCSDLPPEPRALLVSPFMRAVLEYLRLAPGSPGEPEYQRVLRVFLDQLKKAPAAVTYLPAPADQALNRLLHELEHDPADRRSLAELARSINLTERTLARRCLKELGMPLGEWRSRLRVIKALPLLEEGRSVEAVAFDSGYSGASAFIVMFRRVTGHTPACYRGKG